MTNQNKNIYCGFAKYYDILYENKDYLDEANKILNRINRSNQMLNGHNKEYSILELGCGSAKHAIALLKDKSVRHITGVELSKQMVNMAKHNSASCNNIEIICGDLRTYKSDFKFDVVISIFGVLSYMKENADIIAAIKTASEALKTNGIFIFDFWYGPHVLMCPPMINVKTYETIEEDITRISIPSLNLYKNITDCEYRLHVIEKESKKTKVYSELHNIRYFFLPEIELLLQNQDFEILFLEDFVTGKSIEEEPTNYSVCVCARKK